MIGNLSHFSGGQHLARISRKSCLTNCFVDIFYSNLFLSVAQTERATRRTNNIKGETKQLIVKMGGEIEKYRRTHSWPGKIFNRGNSGPRINSAPPLFVARPRDRKSVPTLIVVIFLVGIVNILRVRVNGLWAHS